MQKSQSLLIADILPDGVKLPIPRGMIINCRVSKTGMSMEKKKEGLIFFSPMSCLFFYILCYILYVIFSRGGGYVVFFLPGGWGSPYTALGCRLGPAGFQWQ